MADPTHMLAEFPAQGRVFSETVAMLDRQGFKEEASMLRAAAGRPPSPPRLAVIGPAKSGKSTLVNVLAGVDVSPTDVDITTSGRLLVFFDGSDQLEAHAVHAVGHDRDDARERISLDDIWRYVSVGGDRASGKDGVSHVEVHVPAGRLSGVIVEDTPGSGSFEEGHKKLALAAAETADAVLFCTSVKSVLTASELDFLEEAAKKVSQLIVAVTHSDLDPRAIRDKLADTRSRLASRVPDPRSSLLIIAVSALEARRLDQAAPDEFNPVLVDQLRRRWGVDRLTEVIMASVVEQADRLRAQNLLRLSWLTVGDLVRENSKMLLAITSPAGAETAEEALKGFQSRARRVDDELVAEIRSARSQMSQDVNDWRFASGTGWQQRINNLQKTILLDETQVQRFVLELLASIAADATGLIDSAMENFTQALERVMVDEDGKLLISTTDLYRASAVAGPDSPDITRFQGPATSFFGKARTAMSGLMAGKMAAWMLAGVVFPGSPLAVAGLGLAAGVLTVAPVFKEQQATVVRQGLVRWSDETHHRVAASAMATIDAMEARALPEIRSRLRAGIEHRRGVLQQRIALARSSEAEREGHVKQLRDRQASLDMIRSILAGYVFPPPTGAAQDDGGTSDATAASDKAYEETGGRLNAGEENGRK